MAAEMAEEKLVVALPAKKSSALKDFIAGGVGGVCVVVSGYPLDTIKVRLQTMPKVKPGETPVFSGMMDCFKKTIRQEGFRGLYKGMVAPLVGITPLCAVSFFGYGVGKNIQLKNPGDQLTIPQYGIAGIISGVFQTVVTVPVERMKCLLQIQRESKQAAKYKGSLDCLVQVYRSEGIRGLYRGTGATLLRDLPGNGIYFMSYELIIKLLTPKGKRREDVGPLKVLFAGGMAGVCMWCIAIAPDTMKSRIQTAPEGKYPHGIRSVFGQIIRNEGVTALFRGATPVLVRAFPANAACFLGYEFTMRFLNWLIPQY